MSPRHARCYSDVDRKARGWRYAMTLLESGDKIFGECSGTSQAVVNPDGSKSSKGHVTRQALLRSPPKRRSK
jgi:hypothetical protein